MVVRSASLLLIDIIGKIEDTFIRLFRYALRKVPNN